MVLAALAVLLASCRTTDEATEVKADEKAAIAPLPTPSMPPPARVECPVPDAVCPTDYAPVLCTTNSYRGRTLPEHHVLMAWGNNTCQAKLSLQREACRRNMLPSVLGRHECVPDPSAGHCPPVSLPCPEGHTPSVCSASGYAAQDLKGEQVIRAWGRSACDATQRLHLAACRRHLDPTLLRKIACGNDASDGECGLPEAECEDSSKETVCVAGIADGKKLAVPLEASGPSACAAKQALARLACRQDLKPSRLDQVVCRIGG